MPLPGFHYFGTICPEVLKAGGILVVLFQKRIVQIESDVLLRVIACSISCSY